MTDVQIILLSFDLILNLWLRNAAKEILNQVGLWCFLIGLRLPAAKPTADINLFCAELRLSKFAVGYKLA